RADGQHRLGELRPRQGSALRALHGPLRLRAHRGAGRQLAPGRQPEDAPVATGLNCPPESVPVVLFALRREGLLFRRALAPHAAVPGGPCPAWRCGPEGRAALVLETGVGAKATRTALDWLVERGGVRPAFVLGAGFCGGLRAGLRVGDLVLASEVL